MGNPLIGTKTVTQVGMLVNDVDKTAEKFAKFFGVEKPEIVTTDALEIAQTEYNGKPTQARSRIAFFKIGENFELEIIEPDKFPSVWRDMLDKNGEGFHHIAFRVEGMKEMTDRLSQIGMTIVQKGEYTGGRYAYIDSIKELKMMIELLEFDK
jgi:methylmalonyl-CoA/ethylmalonyl-CoA epimerase